MKCSLGTTPNTPSSHYDGNGCWEGGFQGTGLFHPEGNRHDSPVRTSWSSVMCSPRLKKCLLNTPSPSVLHFFFPPKVLLLKHAKRIACVIQGVCYFHCVLNISHLEHPTPKNTKAKDVPCWRCCFFKRRLCYFWMSQASAKSTTQLCIMHIRVLMFSVNLKSITIFWW